MEKVRDSRSETLWSSGSKSGEVHVVQVENTQKRARLTDERRRVERRMSVSRERTRCWSTG